MKNIGISVVIPARQNIDDLNKCVDSILRSGYPDYEIIVVDDGSIPPLWNIMSKDGKIKVFRNERNMGAGFSRNLGVKMSGREVIYFVDSDVEVNKDNLSRLSCHFDDPAVDVVEGISDYVPLNDVFIAHYQALLEWFFHYHPEKAFVFHFNPRNAAIRKKVFLDSGGFDQSFGTTLEDADLTRRLLARGIKITNDTGLVVRHKYPSSMAKAVKNHFTRGFTWFRLCLENSKGTKNVSGSIFQGAVIKGIIMHFLFYLALALSIFRPEFLLLAALFYVLHLKYFFPFYLNCYRKKGLLFALRAMATKLIMSFAMGASQFLSLISLPFYKEKVLKTR